MGGRGHYSNFKLFNCFHEWRKSCLLSRASFLSHMTLSDNLITRKLLIFFFQYGLRNKKNYHINKIRNELRCSAPPGRPYRCMTGKFSAESEDTNLKFWQKIFFGFKIVVSNFIAKNHFHYRSYSVSRKVRFLPLFHMFWLITQEPLNVSKIWLICMEECHKTYQNHCRFDLENSFKKGIKSNFLVKMTDFYVFF